jgi:hypothetical protein
MRQIDKTKNNTNNSKLIEAGKHTTNTYIKQCGSFKVLIFSWSRIMMSLLTTSLGDGLL